MIPMRVLLLTLPLSLLLASAAAAADFYVAPNGSDDNPGTKVRPFATLARARDAARERIAKGLTADVTVTIRRGTYRITEPIVFGPEDSGTDSHSVTYAASGGEKVVISGGRVVTGWQADADGTWRATIPDVKAGKWAFRELFINGRRARRARHPNSGYLRIVKAGPDRRTSFEFKPGDIRAYDDLTDVEVVYLHDWSISRTRVRSVDEGGNTITLAQPIGAGARGFWLICGFERHPRYFLENGAAFLDAPGEWHLETRRGVLRYRPRSGEAIDKIEAIAPAANGLLVVRGDADRRRPVKNLRFVALRFEHCAFPLPVDGYAGMQAGFHRPGAEPMSPAVLFEAAESCRFEDGAIAHVGGSGIWFGRSCRNNALIGSSITDAGGNGVMIGEGNRGRVGGKPWWQAAPQRAATGNVVKNNVIEHCGRAFFGCVGVWVGLANKNVIAHNEIRRLPYTGVSVGWMWNPTPTPCKANIVENNHIHHVMQTLSDGGGIYTLGIQPGSVLRGNVIHDVPVNAGRAESNGMFIDEGSTDLVIADNVIYDVVRSPLRFHKATVNLVRNNVLAVGKGVPPFRYNATNSENIKKENNTIVQAGSPPAADAAKRLEEAKGRAGLEPAYRKKLRGNP